MTCFDSLLRWLMGFAAALVVIKILRNELRHWRQAQRAERNLRAEIERHQKEQNL